MKHKKVFFSVLALWLITTPIFAVSQLIDTTNQGTYTAYEFVFGKLSGQLNSAPSFMTGNGGVDVNIYDCGSGNRPLLAENIYIPNDGVFHSTNSISCVNLQASNNCATPQGQTYNATTKITSGGTCWGGGAFNAVFNPANWYGLKLFYRNSVQFSVYGSANSTDWSYYANQQGTGNNSDNKALGTLLYPYFNLPNISNANPISTSISITNPANLSTNTTTAGYTTNGTYTLGDTFFIGAPFINIKLTYHSTSTGNDLSTTLDNYTFTATTSTTTQNWSRALPLNLANATAGAGTYWLIEASVIDSVYLTTTAATNSRFYMNISGSQLPAPFIQSGGTYSTSTGAVLASCNDLNLNFFQAILCYVFVPKYEGISQFSGLFELIKNKPPVGYFYSVKTALSGLSTSTPAFEWNTASSSIPLFGQIKTGLSWIFWLLLAFWIFNRLRHLEL
jgi:hypothetical protein